MNALEARVRRMNFAELKAICRELYDSPRDGDEEVFDMCLGRLAGIMGDHEFTQFCESL